MDYLTYLPKDLLLDLVIYLDYKSIFNITKINTILDNISEDLWTKWLIIKYGFKKRIYCGDFDSGAIRLQLGNIGVASGFLKINIDKQINLLISALFEEKYYYAILQIAMVNLDNLEITEYILSKKLCKILPINFQDISRDILELFYCYYPEHIILYLKQILIQNKNNIKIVEWAMELNCPVIIYYQVLKKITRNKKLDFIEIITMIIQKIIRVQYNPYYFFLLRISAKFKLSSLFNHIWKTSGYSPNQLLLDSAKIGYKNFAIRAIQMGATNFDEAIKLAILGSHTNIVYLLINKIKNFDFDNNQKYPKKILDLLLRFKN